MLDNARTHASHGGTPACDGSLARCRGPPKCVPLNAISSAELALLSVKASSRRACPGYDAYHGTFLTMDSSAAEKMTTKPYDCREFGWNYSISYRCFGECLPQLCRVNRCGYNFDPNLLPSFAAPRGAARPIYIDVGANVGQSLLPFASLGWRIVAFDPVGVNAQILRLNLAQNCLGSHVTFLEAGASAEDGNATLTVPEGLEDNAAFSSRAVKVGGRRHAVPVLLRSVDSVFAERPDLHPADVRYVKIDVRLLPCSTPLPCACLTGCSGASQTQGHEISVLQGMRSLLSRASYPHLALRVEYDARLQVAAGHAADELPRLAASLGFDVRRDGLDLLLSRPRAQHGHAASAARQLAAPDRARHRGDRFLLVSVNTNWGVATGFNNQRQILMIGAVVARMLNRTLVVPHSLMANRHTASVRIGSIWELGEGGWGSVAPVVTQVPRALSDAPHTTLHFNTDCCDIGMTDVEHAPLVRRSWDDPVVRLNTPGWGMAFPTFRYGEQPVYGWLKTLASAFNDSIRRCSAEHLAKLHDLAGDAVVHAMHVRIGDRSVPHPLLWCEPCNLSTSAKAPSPCVAPNYSVLIACALAHNDIRRGDAVYVATDSPDSKKMKAILSQLVRAGLRIFTWKDMATKPANAHEACAAVPVDEGLHVSVLEQLICSSVNGHFFPDAISSWSELVLLMRSGRQGTLVPGDLAAYSAYQRATRAAPEYRELSCIGRRYRPNGIKKEPCKHGRKGFASDFNLGGLRNCRARCSSPSD